MIDLHDGGSCILDLGNGCVGTLRAGASHAGLHHDQFVRQRGERIDVEVVRTIGAQYTGPRSILLDTVELADARWNTLAALRPVGSLLDAAAVHRGDFCYLMVSADGATGWLADREVSWSRLDPQAHERVAAGQMHTLRVIGHLPKRRQMLLSLRQAREHPLEHTEWSGLVGRTFSGVVTRIIHYGAFVRLPIGVDGLLHRNKRPSGLLMALGDRIIVMIIALDKGRRRIALRAIDSAALDEDSSRLLD